MNKVSVGIIGPGNIGTDLMYKIKNNSKLEMDTMVGIYSDSEGLKRAKNDGYNITSEGLESVIDNDDIQIYFDATSANAHTQHASILKEANKIAIDLTPAAVGPYVCPVVNLNRHLTENNVNLITCGGQATIPIVAAINEVVNVEYAEVVATISSFSAGQGTRQSIDEFTQTTAKGLEVVGGADQAKAIIILNPAEPPIMMRNTIYTRVKNKSISKISEAVCEMKEKVQKYVPGYKVTLGPVIEEDKVTTMVEIEGAGDYLPKYAGNLDIETSAAVRIGEVFADKLMRGVQ